MRAGISFAASASAAWSLTVLVPLVLPEFPVVTLSCARYCALGIASLVFALPALMRSRHLLRPSDAVRALALALLGNVGFFILFTFAVREAGVSVASLILGLLPLTLICAKRGGMRVITEVIAPLTLALSGTVLMTMESWHGGEGGGGNFTRGVLCGVAALASWTLYSLWNQDFLTSDSRFDGTLWASLCGVASGFWGVLFFLIWGDSLTVQVDGRWGVFWVVTIVVAVIGSWAGGAFWNAASARLPHTILAQCVVFETLCAVAYGHLWSWTIPSIIEGMSLLALSLGVLWALVRLARLEPFPR